jgi:tetraacyldisaccharide 4'-kinase
MLSILAAIYGKVIDVRNRLYDLGVFDTFDLGARTISIGNVTTGGTGKTPLVASVAKELADRGETVCILTRGYGRKDVNKRVLVSDGERLLADVTDSGDEPYELAEKLLGKAIVIADADRVDAAEWALRRFGVTAFVLDDGFQHRKAKRDVDIVCIDAMNPFGGGKVLPAGRLREPLVNLVRADVVVITRADLVDDNSYLRSQISELASNASIFESGNKIVNADDLAGLRAFAFCGLGNPDNFYQTVKREGIEIVGRRSFADHQVYSQTDIKTIEFDASTVVADCLITTAKDAVKLREMRFAMPLHVVEIQIEIDDEQGFAASL